MVTNVPGKVITRVGRFQESLRFPLSTLNEGDPNRDKLRRTRALAEWSSLQKFGDEAAAGARFNCSHAETITERIRR